MTNNNMELWNNVCRSEKEYLKDVGYGARKYKAINPQSQIRAITEQFGVCGKGWGIISEKFDYESIKDAVCYTAILWWSENEKRYEIPIHSSVETYNSKGRYDSDCQKKAATDALTKGLSKLGFNADVFLGEWDKNGVNTAYKDNKYVTKDREQKQDANKKNQVSDTVLEEDHSAF